MNNSREIALTISPVSLTLFMASRVNELSRKPPRWPPNDNGLSAASALDSIIIFKKFHVRYFSARVAILRAGTATAFFLLR